MPEKGRQSDGGTFREAISQWQLAARTEVKRASSLPSSMFDACDPMLEARLADSVEAMLTCLQQPATAGDQVPDGTEQRAETVTPAELQQLPVRVGPPARPGERLDHRALEHGLTAEYLAELVDLCASGSEPSRSGAAALLQRDFGVRVGQDLTTTTRELAACLQGLPGGCPAPLLDRIDAAVRAIAANVVAWSTSPPPSEPRS